MQFSLKEAWVSYPRFCNSLSPRTQHEGTMFGVFGWKDFKKCVCVNFLTPEKFLFLATFNCTFFKSTMSTPSLNRISSLRFPLPGAKRIFLIHPRPVWIFLEVWAFKSHMFSIPSTSPCTIWSFLNAIHVTVPTPGWNRIKQLLAVLLKTQQNAFFIQRQTINYFICPVFL